MGLIGCVCIAVAAAAPLPALAAVGFAPTGSLVVPSGFGPVGVAVDNTGSAPPEILTQKFSNVTAASALLTAEFRPENLAGRYFYEYAPGPLTSDAAPKRTPPLEYEASGEPIVISAQLGELSPDAEYHFRIILENTEEEVITGSELSFKTLAMPEATLPDGRVYEKVTQPGSNANVYVPKATFGQTNLNDGITTRFAFQVAPSGAAVTYPAEPALGGFGRGGSGLGNQYLARRSESGWSESSIQPPGYVATYYQGFSSDLSIGVLNSGNFAEPKVPRLSAEAPGDGYKVLYARSNNDGTYKPFFTSIPTRTPELFGTNRIYTAGKHESEPIFAGASDDNSHKIFEANDALLDGTGLMESELTADVEREVKAGENHEYLYDSTGAGHLDLVDVSPEGKVLPNATFGALASSDEETNSPNFQNVISADGRRIYWTDVNSGVVFVRIDADRTLQVSAHAARYWTSGADGRYAFYTEEGQLYRFDVDSSRREALMAESSGALGVVGTSADGQTVYAVATGVLGSGVSAQGAKAVPGEPNLYLLRHGSEPILVAPLSAADGVAVEPFDRINPAEEFFGDWQPGLGHRTAEVTQDGAAAVFMSNQPLKTVGHENGVSNPSDLDEVYLFEAATGGLYCVSCSASGEAPPTSLGAAAAFVPVSWSDTYLPQWMAGEGSRVFFNSAVPLVSQDTNGGQDVYEWELEGTGSCEPGEGTNGGCVYLLSAGSSKAWSWLIGSSASGDDVFLATRSQLVPYDNNEAFDLYDARVDGLKPVTPPACTGTGCQGIPSLATTFATPPTTTFEGVGNITVAPQKHKSKPLTRAQKLNKALIACRRDRQRRRRSSCETRAQRRYGRARHTRKSTKGRR